MKRSSESDGLAVFNDATIATMVPDKAASETIVRALLARQHKMLIRNSSNYLFEH